MLLPDSNLPSSSLPWAREVVKQLDGLSRAVNTNEVNNAARDATTETNINNLSELMADQIELRTYAVEPKTYVTEQIVGSPGLPSPVYIPTPELSITITLNKERNFLINFSSSYLVSSTFPNATAPYGWDIGCEIYLDGEMVDTESVGASRSDGPGFGYQYDSGPISSTFFIPVSAGTHTVSAKIYYQTYSTGGITNMNISGNNLVVTVVQ